MMRALDGPVVERFRTLIAQRLGLQADYGRTDRLADVLRRRMEIASSPSAAAYLDFLRTTSPASDELRALAAELTITETFFFRNIDQLTACAEVVLPERIRARGQDRRLRILSAGCASGEEAYSLAIVVRESFPGLDARHVTVVGLDINRSMLQKAAQARYSAWSLRTTPEDLKRRYFRQEGSHFVLDPTIQNMVTFMDRNLVDDDQAFWASLDCDIVFCRNVIMYFTPHAARGAVRSLLQALSPDGYLFLGHAETLRGLSHDCRLCHTHNTFYYRRHRSGAPSRLIARPDPVPSGRASSPPPSTDQTASWIAAIDGASKRITALTEPQTAEGRVASGRVARPAPTVPAADLTRVLDAMRLERFQDALAILHSVPLASHDDSEALLLQAVLLANTGRMDEARQACRRLLAIDELNAGARYVMALCCEQAGDLIGAVEHHQAAIHLDAGFAMPRLHLGLIVQRSGDAAGARDTLEQALSLLVREDESRLVMFGGGFSRETLLEICRAQLGAAGVGT
jgi:chemotaxis protein methyltransferase CheR